MVRFNVTLRKRLERVEKRLGGRKPLPTVIMGIYPEEQPGPILGIEGGGKRLDAKVGETLKALQARAAAELPARFLRTLYARQPAVQRDEGPSGYPTPAPAPEDAPRAGIGRVATVAELQRMAALPFPAERPI